MYKYVYVLNTDEEFGEEIFLEQFEMAIIPFFRGQLMITEYLSVLQSFHDDASHNFGSQKLAGDNLSEDDLEILSMRSSGNNDVMKQSLF